MKNNIYYIVRCILVCITVVLITAMVVAIVFAIIIYKLIMMIFSYLHKGFCKVYNTISKYKQVDTKVNGRFELNLRQ